MFIRFIRIAFILLITILLIACGGKTTRPTSTSVIHTPPPVYTNPPPTATSRPASTHLPAPASTATLVPLVAWVDPSFNLERVNAVAVFTVHFNQPVDPSSAKPALVIEPNSPTILQWNDSHTSVSLSLANGFAPGKHYRINVNGNLKAIAGGSLAEVTGWDLQKAVYPTVSYSGITGETTNLNPELLLIFDHDMNKASVETAITLTPEVRFSLEWNERTIIIQLQEFLKPGTRYKLSIEKTAADKNGLSISRKYSWEFRTAIWQVEVTGPTVQNRSLPLLLRFSYPVDPISIENSLSITPAITGTLTWGEKVLSIFSDTPLTLGKTYTLEFKDTIIERNGIKLPALKPITYYTPPPILATRPTGKNNSNSTSVHIEVDFERPVSPASVETAFQVSPPISGTFSWEGSTIVFTPLSEYKQGTNYSVTISPDAKDTDGKPFLYKPYTFSFTIAYQPDRRGILASYGSNAQVVDAHGERAVQFGSRSYGDEFTFQLYRLDLQQFVKTYREDFAWVHPWYNEEESDSSINLAGAELASTWKTTVAHTVSEMGTQNTYIPANVLPGLYILNLTYNGETQDQLFVILTRNGLVIKRSGDQVLIWANDFDGKPASGTEVRVYNEKGESIREGTTDENGIYRTTIWGDAEPMFAMARSVEGDISIVGFEGDWLNWDWNYWSEYSVDAEQYAAYLYTDRPIYRPGQTMYFKGILRKDHDSSYEMLPVDLPVTVKIRDARDNIVQTLELRTNYFSAIIGEFVIADGAMLGTYAIEVELEAETHRQTFMVQSYHKPDYQVTVTASQEQVLSGAPVTITVDASYFFGQPVANGRVKLMRYRLYACDYNCVSDSDYTWFGDYSQQPQVFTLDKNGHATISVKVQYTYSIYDSSLDIDNYSHSSLQYRTWGYEVTVDDGTNQAVSDFVAVKVFNASEQISIDLESPFLETGNPVSLTARVTTLDGNPVNARLLKLELLQWVDWSYKKLVQNAALATDMDGEASLLFTPEKEGYYLLRLSGEDDYGNIIGYNRWVYVSGNPAQWLSDGNLDLRVTAERESYQPSQIAHLMVESTFDGPALITVERRDTHRTQWVHLTTPLTQIDLPIQAEDAPNIYVTVNAWKEQDIPFQQDSYTNIPDFKLIAARVELQVPVTGKALQVTLTSDQNTYSPGDQATFTIKVTDASGKPAVAELSLALVDEAIFSLSDELTGPIYHYFYAARALAVDTSDSMSLFRELTDWGEGGGGGGGDDNMRVSLRSDFQDTAVWVPILRTDASGTASVTITLPDNLTSWRLTAKAFTKDTRVGEAVINILTQKPILLRPQLPTNLITGDQIILTSAIHNYSDITQTLYVNLESPRDLISINSSSVQTVTLHPGTVGQVSWDVTALGIGETPITISACASLPCSAMTSQVEDSILLPLTIQPLAVHEVSSQVGEFKQELIMPVLLPENAITGTIRLDLSRTIAGSILEGLEYLTGYPHGCVEQTMSRALPNAVVGRAYSKLGLSQPGQMETLQPMVSAGLQRLYGYQHTDGGWGWWLDDITDAHQTAWVVYGLAVTAEAGFEVDPAVIERGASWVQKHLEDMDIRTRAYALYSLAVAGYGDLPALETLYAGSQSNLDTFSLAALALAYHELGKDDKGQEILMLISDSATEEDDFVYWVQSVSDGEYHRKSMSSSIRTTALVLDALVRIQPQNEKIPNIVRWLISQRQDYGWGSTNETAYTILALTDYLPSVQEISADTYFFIELNGRTVYSGTLGKATPSIRWIIPIDEIDANDNILRVSVTDNTRLFFTLNQSLYLAQKEIAAQGDIDIVRTYRDPKTGQVLNAFTPGQLVKVQLTFTIPNNAFYLILEDQLPAGFEALNESLNTTSHDTSDCYYDYDCSYYRWQEYGYNHKEIRGNRVMFFMTDPGTGQRTITYLVRVTQAGSFVALPAEIYAMYAPEIWGSSSSAVITIPLDK